ncbi:hypothetical protein PENSPDRAFT_220286 [Peniophora sp. CONT]|nr:hypothetical protein PENSPDRAFT_220286 [Peniophora sp. CONT]
MCESERTFDSHHHLRALCGLCGLFVVVYLQRGHVLLLIGVRFKPGCVHPAARDKKAHARQMLSLPHFSACYMKRVELSWTFKLELLRVQLSQILIDRLD